MSEPKDRYRQPHWLTITSSPDQVQDCQVDGIGETGPSPPDLIEARRVEHAFRMQAATIYACALYLSICRT